MITFYITLFNFINATEVNAFRAKRDCFKFIQVVQKSLLPRPYCSDLNLQILFTKFKALKQKNQSSACASWTHGEHSDERPLQQTDQNVAPVMLVVGHPGVAYEQGERHQEELDGRSDQARPFPLHPGVDVELHTESRSGGGFLKSRIGFKPIEAGRKSKWQMQTLIHC